MNSVAASKDSSQPASQWTSSLQLLAAVCGAILLIFWSDVWDMVATWWNISTYAHCLIIVPIIYWLVHQRRQELVKIKPVTWAPGLLIIAAAAFGWLIGEAAGISFARQLGVVMMLQGAVITILGPNVARGLAFPLFYAFFLVPFGEEIVPQLQTITAKMCMILLGWSGIPAYIDGVFISTPTGYFEVAEACSGVKFLIAMVAYGALVANVCFKSWPRRIMFMILATITPIIANGIRAWGTIYIAHHSSIDFAAGFDHIFYGWIFFALVLVLVMGIGWKFFDRGLDENSVDAAELQTEPSMQITWKKATAVIVALLITPVVWAGTIDGYSSRIPAEIDMPTVAGWQQVEYQPTYQWEPRFDGNSWQKLARYRNVDGAEVDLFIAVYDRQQKGRELVGYGQGAIDPDSKWAWSAEGAPIESGSAIRITAPGPVVREVVSFYRVGDVLTGSKPAIKFETVKVRLFSGKRQAAAILISSERINDVDPRTAIDQFISDLGPIDVLADKATGVR